MKFHMFAMMSLLALPALAQAGCEDGTSLAEDAALRQLQARGGVGCQATSISQTESDGEFEEHLVEVTCRNVPLVSFQVLLREFEDAVCGVHRATQIQNTGYPGMSVTRTCVKARGPGPTYVIHTDRTIPNRGLIEKLGSERGRFFSSRKASGPILSFRFVDDRSNQAIVIATGGHHELQQISDFGRVTRRESLTCR